MINLNECKFGDRLMTKDGHLAIFLHRSYHDTNACVCAIRKDKFCIEQIKYHFNGKRCDARKPKWVDIVAEWDDRFFYPQKLDNALRLIDSRPKNTPIKLCENNSYEFGDELRKISKALGLKLYKQDNEK